MPSINCGPCTEHNAPRAYVAGPIFTPDQLATVARVVEILHTCGYVSYSPSRDGIMLAPTDPPERRDEVFFSNKNAIRQSDLLVALLDTKDTGTIWELGMSMTLDIPVIAVTLTSPQMNVMLERGVVCHVREEHDLGTTLLALRPHLLYGRKSTNELRSMEAAQRRNLKAAFSYSGRTE
jgi:nucleoside 2-deoxyribosyltransferase